MFMPPTVTARDSFRSLCPLQVWQGVMRMNCSYSCLLYSEAVSL